MMRTSFLIDPATQSNLALRGLTVATFLMVACVAEFLLSGCSSTPKAPTEALQAAEVSIANAEQARVADYASPELAEAREKLVAARLAVEKKEMVSAERLAVQAKADAELATARAAAAKAKAVNEEMQKSNSVLQQELQRNTGAQ
jgi:hypothetical protein